MRPDMHEVVIERPRGGWRVPRRTSRWDWRAHDEEASPRRESTSRHRGGTKHLSDLIGPLRRFLDGAVGRRWDDVHAELRAGLSPRSLLHRHILEHVDRMVADPDDGSAGLHVDADGVLRRREGGWRRLDDGGRPVTPRTFLLRRVGRPWPEVKAEWAAAAGGRWMPHLVDEAVVRARGGRGRLHLLLPATESAPARPGPPLPRGRLYVEAGILRVVR